MYTIYNRYKFTFCDSGIRADRPPCDGLKFQSINNLFIKNYTETSNNKNRPEFIKYVIRINDYEILYEE